MDKRYASYLFDMTFREYIHSTKSPEELAEIFYTNYERPGRKDPSLLTRQQNAREWYDFLLPYAPDVVPEDSQMPTAKPAFKISAFKIDKVTTSSAEFSFIACKAIKGSYTLDTNNPINLKEEEIKEGLNTFTVNNLKPNSKYKVKLEIDGEGDNNFSETLDFEIPQAYPESVRKITLSQDLKVEIIKPNNFGYWEKNSKGYDIQLIVNGKCIDTVVETSIEGSLKGKSYNFTKYTDKKIDDVIQVGVTVWVKDDSGNKICDTDRYQSPMPKTSNTICLLSKPVKAYLNID